MIHMVNAATINAGGITVSIDPYDSGTQTSDSAPFTDADSPVAIDAGKYRVVVYNEGLTNITVNGDTVPPGNNLVFEAFNNANTQKTDLTPAITIIVPSGGQGSYSWTGPSA